MLDDAFRRYADTAAFAEAVGRLGGDAGLDSPAVLYIAPTKEAVGICQLAYKAKGQVYVYSADTNVVTVHPHNFYTVLGQRLKYVEEARSARVFGVLIYSVPIFNATKSRLIPLLQSHGKEYCLIYMGKPTSQKLLNFQDIDMFIRVSCPSAPFLPNRDLFKPVISPFEFECSLTPSVPTTYETDYRQLLSAPFPRPDSDEAETAISVYESEAVSRFSGRSYKGLVDAEGEQTGEVVQGRSGFAQKYQKEGEQDRSAA